MSHNYQNHNDDIAKQSIPSIDDINTYGEIDIIISTDELAIAQWYWENKQDMHIIYQGLYWGKRSDYPDSLLEG